MATPGEPRLTRPPSDRYRTGPAEVAPVAGSARRGVLFGLGATLAWAALTVLLGGLVTLSAGLLVLAVAFGRLIALATGSGAGPALAGTGRIRLVLGLVVLGFVLGQLGLWIVARLEGGVLGPIDYALTTFGLLAPLQLVLPAAIAWWTVR